MMLMQHHHNTKELIIMARPKCYRTGGKTKFPTELDAKIALAGVQKNLSVHRRQKARGNEPTRVYQCEFCGQWHMTSQTKGRKRPA